MLVIRSEQVSQMGEAVAARFDDELVRHLSSYAPFEAEMLGPDGLRRLVLLGKHRADVVGFTHRETIRLYLDLMVLLGSGFATDPQYPWVTAALAPSGETQEQKWRARVLHRSALRYTHAVLGEKREFLFAALEQVASKRGLEPWHRGIVPETLISQMRIVFLEKCSYLGDAVLESVIQLAARRVKDYDFSPEPGIALFTILILLFGHEVDRDPTVPWVEAALRDSAGSGPRERVERLYSTTCANINLLLANHRTHNGIG